MDKLGDIFSFMKSAKAYAATAVALGGILLTLSADDNFHSLGIPDTFIGKMAGVGTLLVAFGAVFGVRNARTVSQAQRDLERAAAGKPAAKRAPRKRAVAAKKTTKRGPKPPNSSGAK